MIPHGLTSNRRVLVVFVFVVFLLFRQGAAWILLPDSLVLHVGDSGAKADAIGAFHSSARDVEMVVVEANFIVCMRKREM